MLPYQKGFLEKDHLFNSYFISGFDKNNASFSDEKRLIRYHYTSSSALLKILTQFPTLRFTDIRFMNDHSEMVMCVKVLMEYLSKHIEEYPFCQEVVEELLLKKHSKDDYINLNVSIIDFEENTAFSYMPGRCFVFCMSESSDSLDMWNYYVHNGKYEGYNIGFDVYNFLKSFDINKSNIVDPVIFHYGNILYKRQKQEEAIKAVLDFIEKNKTKKRTVSLQQNMATLRNYIEVYGAFFKHESFKNEREFRIVAILNDGFLNITGKGYVNSNLKKLRINYYERNGVIVPFLEVPINKDAIKSVTVSPTVEREIAKTGLKDFLISSGYKTEIKESSIPIRF